MLKASMRTAKARVMSFIFGFELEVVECSKCWLNKLGK